MIIDCHTHAFPDDLAPRAIESLSQCSNISPFTDGTLAGLRDSMRKAGIDKSIVAPIATKPAQVAGINVWAAVIKRRNRKLISLGTLHPNQDDWMPDINQLIRDGIPGIKLHPEYQSFFVDSPEVIPMYRAIADAGLFVLFHAGIDIGLPPPVHCTPDRLARVLDAVPHLKVIAGHMGGYKYWGDVERYLAGRELYFDTAYCFNDMGADRLTALIKSHGVEQILFGTDSPWTDQSVEIAHIRSLPLTPSEIDAILGGNAARLLRLSR